MKTKLFIFFLIILLVVAPITANATTPRTTTILPEIHFDGTKATCYVTIQADSVSDEIYAKITLLEGTKCVAEWTVEGQFYCTSQKTFSCTKGKEYTLTIEATINDIPQSTVSYSGTCK